MKKVKVLSEIVACSQPNVPELDFGTVEGSIFPHNDSAKDVPEYEYIPSEEPSVDDALGNRLNYAPGTLTIGGFESRLIWNFLYAKERIFCLVGPMGSGKTSTLNYIINVFKNSPCKSCGKLRRECEHQKFITFDFAEQEYSSSETHVKDALARELYLKLKHSLEDTNIINEDEELTEFWYSEILNTKAPHNSQNVFHELREALSDKGITSFEQILYFRNNRDRKQRLAIRNEVLKKNIYQALTYYFHLWSYTLRVKYYGVEENLIIIFDNIDHKSPSVQTALVQLLETYALRPGPRIFIPIRPETLSANNINSSTNFMGAEFQDGPKPIKVIKHLLQEFIIHKKEYYPIGQFSKEKYDLLGYYFENLVKIIESRHDNSLSMFFDNTCGKSIRLGLKIAEGFLSLSTETVSEIMIKKERLTGFYIMNRLIIRKNSIFSLSKSNVKAYEPIENVFRVLKITDSRGLLVKVRILQFLNEYQQDGQNLAEIRTQMRCFGYSENELVRNALNDLLYVQRQLVISEDRDGFETEEDFHGSGKSKFWITDIGKGYLELIKNLDYTETILYDCLVPEDMFPPGKDISKMTNSLFYLSCFLELLCKQDFDELQYYFERHQGYDEYTHIYGTVPLSVIIMNGIYPSVNKILKKEINNLQIPFEARKSREDVLLRFEKIIKEKYQSISTLIGVNIPYPDGYHL